MRLVSFDVGIKNLAYCVFDIHPTTWSIPGWTCANLLDDPSTSQPLFCCHLVKKGKSAETKVCGKKAKWTAKDEHFCETHAKMKPLIIPKKAHELSQLKKKKVDVLKAELALILTPNEEKQTKAELVETLHKYYEANSFKKVGEPQQKSASSTDLVSIGRAIKRQLDSDPALNGATHIIVENQISTIASRMKTIQGMIAQYFIMRFGDAVKVEFISSHNKLKGFALQNDDATYKANKTNGVAICRRFLATNPEMKEWDGVYEKSKKRDDLADCFLQAVWYSKANNLLFYSAEDLKINSVFVS
jgi:hypothetical protein